MNVQRELFAQQRKKFNGMVAVPSHSKALMPVRYSDTENGILLTNYADAIVYDNKQKVLCLIRFGGYPEQVEAMTRAIQGGGAIEALVNGCPIPLRTLAKQYIRKVSHDGIYAEAMLAAQDDAQRAAEKEFEKDSPKDGNENTQDLPPRNCYLYVAAGDREALFDAIDRKTAVPLIPDFADYLLAELEKRGALRRLTVLPATAKFEAWVLRCEAGDKNIISIVENGLRSDRISIPGADGPIGLAPPDEVNSVSEYLTEYGPHIAERIKSLFDPLFDPGHDQISGEVLEVNRCIMEKCGYSLYDAQLAVAEAIKRQLERRKVGLIIAECGAGKTKIGLAAIAAATAGLLADQKRRKKDKTFNIVLCPAHVAEKWKREIEESLPDTFAGLVSKPSGLDRLYQNYAKGGKSCYAVITKEAARDGYMRAPAVTWSGSQMAFICPDCGEAVMMDIISDGAKYRDKADQFYFKRENRDNHRCEQCFSPLWTALNPGQQNQDWVKVGGYGFIYRPQAEKHLDKTKNPSVAEKLYKISRGEGRTVGARRKYPLSTTIKKHYKGRIDGLIVDELHQYAQDSGQGDAMAELFGTAKKVVGMTATLINGYASGIFHLLYRMVPGLMELDGQRHAAPSDFSAEYGVVENTYEIVEGEYSANRRTVKRKKSSRQLPGVSPLVYSRFLLEYAAFLSLTDMGKDLPEYEEIPVALTLPEDIQKTCDRMKETLRHFMLQNQKAAKKILSAYLNLLTAYPDQPYNQPPIFAFTGEPVVEPPDMGSIDTVMPKDQAVLDIAARKIAAGENILIYVNWTRLDTQKKLSRLLTEAGYRTAILPATVPPKDRERWVQGKLDEGTQILITNPSLVETGLDLNAFTTLIFYDTGFKLFTLRQASRRSWRINQTAPRVEVCMLYYKDTMQHKAIKLMGTKLAVAAIIEGGFSEEGLAAMSQCEDMTTLMAKELMLGIRDSVEDVSDSFRKMAFLKAKVQGSPGFLTFADAPVEIGTAYAVPIPPIEFIIPAAVTPTAGISDLFAMAPPQKIKHERRDHVLADQLSLLEFTA